VGYDLWSHGRWLIRFAMKWHRLGGSKPDSCNQV